VNTQNFEKWLNQKDYRESTQRLSSRQARHVYGNYLAHGAQPPQLNEITTCKRVVAYCLETGDDPEFLGWLQGHNISTPTRTPMPARSVRKLTAESFPEEAYREILHTSSRSRDPEGAVVFVIAATGLRIGDVLRLPVAHLATALKGTSDGTRGILPLERKGGTWQQIPIVGALDAWTHLYREASADDHSNIASFVTDGDSDSALPGDNAYARVHRWFKRLGKDLNLPGRVHLHRLRRTVAVRGLAATDGDLIAVGQMLGHSTIASTQRYVDEINVGKVAQLQQKIRPESS